MAISFSLSPKRGATSCLRKSIHVDVGGGSLLVVVAKEKQGTAHALVYIVVYVHIYH
jgi:hypothetical protein